jgi:hypothetical protein
LGMIALRLHLFPFINIFYSFEAEHHFRALGDLPGVEFYMVRDILLCCYALFIYVNEINKRENPKKL